MRQAINAEEDKYVRRKPSRHITAESEAFTFLYRARCYLGFFVMAQVSMLVWFSRSSPQSHPELHLTAPLSSGPPVPLTSPPSPPSPALERRADEAQRLAFWRVLERLQNPSDCRRASMYIFLPTPYQSGFGSQLRICELARACHGSVAHLCSRCGDKRLRRSTPMPISWIRVLLPARLQLHCCRRAQRPSARRDRAEYERGRAARCAAGRAAARLPRRGPNMGRLPRC